MKSNKMIVFFAVVLFFGLTACQKKYETEGLTTSTTYYAVFDMKGETSYQVEKGGDFSEPGCTAAEKGVDVPVVISTTGFFNGYSGVEIDIETPDKYVTYYSAENSDGYSIAAERQIWVAETGDLVDNISGLYLSYIERNGDIGNGQYTDLAYVLITKTGDNTYSLSDVVGGYYEYGRAYGSAYRGAGMTITANDIATNDFSFGDAVGVGAFGGACLLEAFSVDADMKTINFTANWDGGDMFVVTLTQVQL